MMCAVVINYDVYNCDCNVNPNPNPTSPSLDQSCGSTGHPFNAAKFSWPALPLVTYTVVKGFHCIYIRELHHFHSYLSFWLTLFGITRKISVSTFKLLLMLFAMDMFIAI